MKYKIKYLKDNILEQAILKAPSPQEAKKHLQDQGYIILSIQELPSILGVLPISQKDIILSLRQLSLMISSSIPLSKALCLLEENASHPKLRSIFSSISNALENGSSLSKAFFPYTKIFGNLCIALIESGSKSGNLAHTLKLLIQELEMQEKNKKAIKKALFYPSILFFSTMGCFVFTLKFVLPNFSQLFSLDSLPLSTQILFFLSNFFSQHSLTLTLTFLTILGALIIWIRSKKGRGEDLILLLPFIGKILKCSYLQRYCLSLKMLLDSGIPLLQAHIIVQDTFSSHAFIHSLNLIKDALANGKPLSTSLKESKLFSSMDLALLEIAQQSGQVEEILQVLSKQYAEKMQERIENIIALLEPLLTLALGGFILLLALGIFVPIWEMSHSF